MYFRHPVLLSLVVFVASACNALAAEFRVSLAPPPAWLVQGPAVDLAATAPTAVGEGVDFRLIDRQVNVASEESFSRFVYRVTSESGVQNNAQFQINYDPAYQEIVIHHVRVLRGAETLDRLKLESIKHLQQERDLERHLYNGESTALLMLEDIRVGDVVDYAFTRRGRNPVFAGRVLDAVSAKWSVPVRSQNIRLILPAGRVLHAKDHGTHTLVASVEEHAGSRHLVWTGRDLTPVQVDGDLPVWFNPYAFVQVSEFKDWRDVVDWALPLYALPQMIPTALRSKVTELVRGLDRPEERAAAILTFVQQEIRYLGIELGPNSHRPTAPGIVFARRFGDCKDKVLLLCTMLEAAGIDAKPALVSSHARQTLADWHASPYAFDHVIARIHLTGESYWVDPTMSQQEGGLRHRGLPPYALALVLAPGEDELTPLVIRETAKPVVAIEETFTVPGYDQPAELVVKTRFHGRNAESVRRYLTSTPLETITREYQNFYVRLYPQAVTSKPVAWEDNKLTNVVTLTEYYRVPDLWVSEAGETSKAAEFYPLALQERSQTPTSVVRSMPLTLAYPDNFTQRTVITLPETWKVEPSSKSFSSSAFAAKVESRGTGNVITLDYSWKALRDHVPTAEVARHAAALQGLRKTLGYTLTHTPATAATTASASASSGTRLNYTLLSFCVVVLVLLSAGAYRIYRRPQTTPPPLEPPPERLVGLKGWLAFVGIGITLRPLILAVSVGADFWDVFDAEVWRLLTTPGSDAYRENFDLYTLVSLSCNLTLLVGSGLLIACYYGRKRLFPRIFIAFAVGNFLLVAGDAVVAQSWGFADDEFIQATTKSLTQLGFQAAIWIPYMLQSKRVKATFTR